MLFSSDDRLERRERGEREERERREEREERAYSDDTLPIWRGLEQEMGNGRGGRERLACYREEDITS